jgi:hypothetical protein
VEQDEYLNIAGRKINVARLTRVAANAHVDCQEQHHACASSAYRLPEL